jgi:hypothetical protein
VKAKDFIKIGSQLLPQLPGFAIEKKLIFKSPVGDFLYGLYFESSADAEWFYFSVFFLPLYVPNDSVHGTFGKRIGRAANWNINNPKLLTDLTAAVQSEALPFLDNVTTLTEIVNYLRAEVDCDRPRVNSHVLEAYAYTLIKSCDYSAALEALAEQKQRLASSTVAWVIEQRNRALLIEHKLLEGPAAALEQLDAWKTESIRNLRLEKYC